MIVVFANPVVSVDIAEVFEVITAFAEATLAVTVVIFEFAVYTAAAFVDMLLFIVDNCADNPLTAAISWECAGTVPVLVGMGAVVFRVDISVSMVDSFADNPVMDAMSWV